jgi:hydroxypyruvate isomerase
MLRRRFINNCLSTASVIATASINPLFGFSKKDEEAFKMKFSPDIWMFSPSAGDNPVDQVKSAFDYGFRACENTMLKNKSTSQQEAISREVSRLGMVFGQFVGTVTFSEVTFAGNDQQLRESVVQDAKNSVETAKRMGTNVVHNVLGLSDPKLPLDFQMANAIELTKRLVDIYEPEGITMIIEPMNHRIDHPGMFLHTVPQAYALVKAVGSDSVKILFDIYHVQIQEGNLLPTLETAWDEVGYFQIGDTPGRKEPGTGEINYKNVLRFIHGKGYRGFLGLEHGHSLSGKEGVEKTVSAYREVDAR